MKEWIRKSAFYFHFVGWSCLSLGFHIDVHKPNIEIHLPFGFIRIGWITILNPEIAKYDEEFFKLEEELTIKWRAFIKEK